ncbi:hypothetical protein RHO12_12690 (plasmid) [Orbus sturtevantii]|uniref:head-tail joining protein n=1 Tax=Orbus sturtevantii TaxID=3074109 RepID=UPI00370DBBC6
MSINWDKELLAPLHDTFGGNAEYRPRVGVAFKINVIFDRAYTYITTLDDGSEMVSTAPAIGIRESDFVRLPVQGDKVFIDDVKELFIVREMHPDSLGGQKLLLNKVNR